MSKAVYGRLFGWIVNKVNQMLAPEMSHQGDGKEIGIYTRFCNYL